MTLLNFSHPLTSIHLAQIEALTGVAVERVLDVKTHFDPDRPFAEQARDLVNALGLSPEEWQTTPLLVNLPSLSVIAALLLAEIHGRCGYFPAVLRLKAADSGASPHPSTPVMTGFEVAEIVNLQAVRDRARRTR